MQLPDYDFKLLPEALKAAGIALGISLVTLLLDFSDDLDAILTDPEAYVRSMVPALLAVVATAFLGVMTRRRNGTAEIEKRLKELNKPAPEYGSPGLEPYPPVAEEWNPEPTFEDRIASLPEEERAAAIADVLGEPEAASDAPIDPPAPPYVDEVP